MPDFTYGSSEEFYYCLWIAQRKPCPDRVWAQWLEERDAFLSEQPGWVDPWRRSVDRQRELRHIA